MLTLCANAGTTGKPRRYLAETFFFRVSDEAFGVSAAENTTFRATRSSTFSAE